MADFINYSLPERRETPNQWDTNNVINEAIANAFKASIDEFDETKYTADVVLQVDSILSASNYDDVPYGGKTLGEAGCAVFCFEHGLRCRTGCALVDIANLAKYIADLGYYEYGKGTYHNLFDHYGLRRASHYDEIFNNLYYREEIVTLLVRNSDYSPLEKNDGSHFVNIIGKEGDNFIIEDSQLEASVKVPMREIFNATRVAWIW